MSIELAMAIIGGYVVYRFIRGAFKLRRHIKESRVESTQP